MAEIDKNLDFNCILKVLLLKYEQHDVEANAVDLLPISKLDEETIVVFCCSYCINLYLISYKRLIYAAALPSSN